MKAKIDNQVIELRAKEIGAQMGAQAFDGYKRNGEAFARVGSAMLELVTLYGDHVPDAATLQTTIKVVSAAAEQSYAARILESQTEWLRPVGAAGSKANCPDDRREATPFNGTTEGQYLGQVKKAAGTHGLEGMPEEGEGFTAWRGRVFPPAARKPSQPGTGTANKETAPAPKSQTETAMVTAIADAPSTAEPFILDFAREAAQAEKDGRGLAFWQRVVAEAKAFNKLTAVAAAPAPKAGKRSKATASAAA